MRTLLVVDDEQMILDMVRRALRRECTVVSLLDSIEALEYIRSSPPDLVLTDLALPKLSGLGLWRELGRLAPSLADSLILMSGDAFDPREAKTLDEWPPRRLLRKPFGIPELQATVRAGLERRPGK